jgi:hypothetical protein
VYKYKERVVHAKYEFIFNLLSSHGVLWRGVLLAGVHFARLPVVCCVLICESRVSVLS